MIIKNFRTSKHIGGIGLYLIFIIVIIALGVSLSGGFTFYQSSVVPTNGERLIPAESLPDIDRKELQLNTIPFVTLPQPTPPSTEDCGNGTVKGTFEPRIVWAISPDPGSSVRQGGKIKIWYNDEWSLTLGAGNVSPISKSPDHILNPNVGDVIQRDANNFPYFPALFLSDTTDDPNNKSGDAENGGIPHKPDEIYGTWKAKGSDETVPPNGISPFNNRKTIDLGPGADPFPVLSNLKFESTSKKRRETEYGSEIIWNVDNLGLTHGRSYRAEFIIHDGDSEGDIGQGCVAIFY